MSRSARREVVHPVPDARLPGWGALWFAVLGGQVVWAMAVLTAYPLVPVGCELGATWVVHLPRWIAMVVAAIATAVGVRAYRQTQAVIAEGTEAPKQARRASFMSLVGALLSASAVFLLVVEDIATWVIDPCL